MLGLVQRTAAPPGRRAAPRSSRASPRLWQVQHRTNVTAFSTPAAQAQLVKPEGREDPWKRAVELEQSGEVVEVQVKRFNKGGLVVKLGDLEGFIPYKQMAGTSIRKGHSGDLSYLVGQKLQARVISVDVQGPKREVVLSEKRVQQAALLQRIKVGSVVRGVVRGLEEYGAFLELVDLPGLTGMVHRSELAWDPVEVLDSGLQRGQVVNVKVVDVDAARCRLSLSIKQLSPDPLKATLDTLEWGPTASVPAEIQRLVDRLAAQPGVEAVVPARQASEPHHVAQELQVFLTRGAEDSETHVVVARLGPVLQELQVLTEGLGREEVKAMLQRAVAAPAAPA